jgi:hypothetical protein
VPGNILGCLSVDCTNALAYIAQKRQSTGAKVTITHLVIKAVAEVRRACMCSCVCMCYPLLVVRQRGHMYVYIVVLLVATVVRFMLLEGCSLSVAVV